MEDSERHDRGMQVRREVLGAQHVDRAQAKRTELTTDFQPIASIRPSWIVPLNWELNRLTKSSRNRFRHQALWSTTTNATTTSTKAPEITPAVFSFLRIRTSERLSDREVPLGRQRLPENGLGDIQSNRTDDRRVS